MLGIGLIAASLLPVMSGAYTLRAGLLPAWSGAPARLAEAVLAIVSLIVVTELLGLVGLLRLVPVVLGCVVAGGALWLAGRRQATRPRNGHALPVVPAGRLPTLLSVAGIAVVVAAWNTRLLPALDHGMTGADTVWYQLPQAARFMQDGSITPVQFFETGAGTAFYPATSALFHALGMLWLGNDFASVLVNLGWLALALVAAWCIGRPYGVGPACVLGLCLLLATPIMVETQPGGAYNDLATVALLLAAAALLVNAGPTGVGGVLAAFAAAAAFGIKLTVAAPVLLLAVGVVAVTPAGMRVRTAGLWLAALLGLGSLWYARNAIAFGNPVPAAHVDLGPLSLPSPPLTTLIHSIAHYFGTPGVWRGTFLPGLLQAYGPAWWAMLGLAAAGMVAALATGPRRVERMLGAVAIVSGLLVLITPQGLGTDDDPVFFRFNLRYPAVALALGLALLPLVPRLRARPARLGLVGVYGLVLAVTQLDPAIWPTRLREEAFAPAPSSSTAWLALGIGAVLLTLLAAAPSAAAAMARPWIRWTAVLVVAVLVLPGGYLLAHGYMRDRYGDYEAIPKLARWARDTKDAQIAFVGLFIQYPLYGSDLSNRVDYLARHGPHGAFTTIRTCGEWRRALNAGGYDYVVTAPFNYPGSLRTDQPPEAEWTGSDPAARRVLSDAGVVTLYRLDGRLNPTCDASS